MHIQGKRDAVRILFVIAKAGEPVKKTAPAGTRVVIHAEKRLQALDFWMRNPDYLASEILIPFEPTPMETRQAAKAVALVKRTAKMVGREIDYALVMTRTNAAFQTNDEKDVRSALGESKVLNVSLVRRAAFTRIFRESELLGELESGKVSNLEQARSNAAGFARSVLAILTGEQVND